MSTLEGADIVCFSNDWGGDPLSKMHLMRLAAKRNRVLWVSSVGNRTPRPTTRDLRRIGRKVAQAIGGLREVEPNLHVLTPLAIPVFGQPWISQFNGSVLSTQVRRAMVRLGMKRPVAISFLPSVAPAFDRIDARLCVYYCVDEQSAFEGAGASIARLEREIIDKSDLVICSAERLAIEKSKLHPNVVIVRHGVDWTHFSRTFDPTVQVNAVIRGLRRPILCFMGLVAEWVDLDLLGAVADRIPNATLLMVGGVDCDASALRSRRNVLFLGRRPYAELPSILKGVDVGLIAFRDNALARAANPLKAREYLAAGLPVVSTPIPEVERLGLAEIASDAAGFVAAIEHLLAAGSGPSRSRSLAMKSESWESRWEDVAELISASASRRAQSRPA